MVKCGTPGCRQDAAPLCGARPKLCGHHCWPRCAVENAHGRRGRARGVQGGPRREAWRQAWRRAQELADSFIRQRARSLPAAQRVHSEDFVHRRIVWLYLKDVFEQARALRSERAAAEVPLRSVQQERDAELVASLVAPRESAEFEAELVHEFGEANFTELVDETSAALVGERGSESSGVGRDRSRSPAREAPEAGASSARPVPAVLQEAPPQVSAGAAVPSSAFLDEYAPQNMSPLGANGEPVVHWMRRQPPYAETPAAWALLPRRPPLPYTDTQVFAEWLRQRPSAARVLGTPSVERFPWRIDSAEWAGPLDIYEGAGLWYRYPLLQPFPEARNDTDTTVNPWVQVSGAGHRTPYLLAMHSTDCYTLARSLTHGLRPGSVPGKGGHRAVYAFGCFSQSRCIKSSGYCTYSQLAHDGRFFGCRYELQVAMFLSGHEGIPAISRGDQYMCVPGSYWVTALWVHVISYEQLQALRETKLYYLLDDWDSRYEFDVNSAEPPLHG